MRGLGAAPMLAAPLSNATPVRAQDDWQKACRVGDRVELHIAGPHWQRCRVTENASDSLMRGMRQEYVEAAGTYRRVGGTSILTKGDVRPFQGAVRGRDERSQRPGGGSRGYAVRGWRQGGDRGESSLGALRLGGESSALDHARSLRGVSATQP